MFETVTDTGVNPAQVAPAFMQDNLLVQSGDALTVAFTQLWVGALSFVPKLAVALIIFVLGWVVGAFIGRIVEQVIRSLKVDKALSNIGVDEVVGQTGFRLNSGAFLGGVIKWFVIVVFLVASINVLGLSQINLFLNAIVLQFLPRVIVSAIVLLIAAVLSEVTQKVVYGSARGAGINSAHLLGLISKWSIWVFALLVVMNQLGVGAEFAQILFTGVVFMLSLAGGLAFGLGGRDVAARILDKTVHE